MTRLISTAFLSLSLLLTGVSAQSEVEMEEDAENLHVLYQKVKAIKDFRIPEGVSRRIGENYAAYQGALDGMNKTSLIRTDNSEFLKNVVATYGGGESEPYKIAAALNNRFEPLSLGYDVGDEYEFITERFSYLDTAGERNALTLLKHVQDNGLDATVLKALHEIYRVKSIEESKNLLSLAVLFAPGNERIERRVARLSTQLEENLKEYRAEEMKVLQSRTWRGNIASTSAGSPDMLASAAMRFMTGLPDWGGNTKKQTKILKVGLWGDWFIAERDALGRPTRYGLPAGVAVSDNTMDTGVVTVYEVSLITRYPKRDTDWYGVWVGKVWRMLESNLPKN